MAMKREYLSVDGEIFGEVTNGVVNFYDRDALGSVVAIEDGAGNTVSTIEYKPFGDVRTYTGENPLAAPRRFLWCGTHGYRFNERYAQYTSHYVRARHYSSLQGMWSTIDPLYPTERAYGYVENRVTVRIDPSGMQGISVLLRGRCCIKYWYEWDDHSNIDCSKWGNSGDCKKLEEAVKSCGITWTIYCQTAEADGKCCQAAKAMGVSSSCLCSMVMSERFIYSQDTPIKSITDLKSGATVGCTQMSAKDLMQAVNKIKKCAPELLMQLNPNPSNMSLGQIENELRSNCNWSILARALQLRSIIDPTCNKGKKRNCEDFRNAWNGGDGKWQMKSLWWNLGPVLRERAQCLEKVFEGRKPC